ncbi:hypothetical protein J3A83DRAFT_646563 [Scleroderma citrinum]
MPYFSLVRSHSNVLPIGLLRRNWNVESSQRLQKLFTRKPPFHDIKSDTDVKAQVMRGPPGRPSDEEACSRLTDGWWDICLLCWKFDPLSRPKIPAITSKIKQLMCTVSTSSLNTQIATEDTAWSPSSNTNSDRVCRQGTGTVATQSSWPNVNLDADYSTDASRHTSLSQLPDTSGSSGNLSNTSELQVQDGGGHSDPTPEMPRVSNGNHQNDTKRNSNLNYPLKVRLTVHMRSSLQKT